MAYCTKAEVQAEFKQLSLDSGSLSTDTLEQWIEEADALIDGRIGLKYSTPIVVGTSPKSFKIVRSLSRRLVAERVRNFLKVKTGDPEKDQEGTTPEKKEIMQMLKDIQTGDLLLSDATLMNSDNVTKDYNSDNDIEHVFQAGEEQW